MLLIIKDRSSEPTMFMKINDIAPWPSGRPESYLWRSGKAHGDLLPTVRLDAYRSLRSGSKADLRYEPFLT